MNEANHPALSTRAGVSNGGLPLVENYFDEALALQAAHQYERATDRAKYRPTFSDSLPT